MNSIIVRAAVAAVVLGAASSAALAQNNFSVAGCQPGNSGVTCVNAGGSTLAGPTYAALWTQFNTATDPLAGFAYAGVGSGAGMRALAGNTSGLFSQCPTGTYAVDIGASDALASSSTNTTATVCGTTSTPLTGLSNFIGAGNAMATGGQFIQIPMFVTPITIPVKNTRITRNGQITMTANDYCGIFSGKITNWNQTSFKNAVAAGPITVYVRADGSGTTFLLTAHLAQVCTTGTTGNSNIAFSAQQTFAALFGGSLPANFASRTGSQGVADAVNTATSAVGYVSPDYTAIAPSPAAPASGNPAYTSLFVAALRNPTSGAAFQPNQAGIKSAVLNPGVSATNPLPPSSAAAAANQNNWVPFFPNPSTGYPIVGTTMWNLASCYSGGTTSSAKGSKIRSFMTQFFTPASNAAYNTILTNSGFAPMSLFGSTANWPGAILGVFVTNKAPRNFNLSINNATACSGVTGR